MRRPRLIEPPRPPDPNPSGSAGTNSSGKSAVAQWESSISGRDTAINRMVAIKAIPLASEFSDAELIEARSRFFREAETAGRLNHPNIVTIYDVGEERGLAYIAMEYLEGPPFERLHASPMV